MKHRIDAVARALAASSTRHRGVVAVLAALACAATADAAVINVPADQATIQGAIAVAQSGDEVRVAPGTYYERLNFLGKAISVIGTGGARQTIVDANSLGTVVLFTSGETSSAVLKGFTLQHGNAGFTGPNYGSGGGIYVASSSPTIDGNIIKSNAACVGAGISVSFASPRISNNVIAGNKQQGCSGGTGGGGIAIGGAASAVVVDNVIESNVVDSSDGGGIALFAAGTPTIRGNIIRGNSSSFMGGGISMYNDSDAKISNNLIVGNSSGQGGGVAFSVPGGSSGPTLVNNTIADNHASLGSEIYAGGFDNQVVITNNIISASFGASAVHCDPTYQPLPPKISFSNVYSSVAAAVSGSCVSVLQANSNLSVNPQFAGTGNAAYQLKPGSPAIDAGSNAAANGLIRDLSGRKRIADGNGDGVAIVDMGAYEVPATP